MLPEHMEALRPGGIPARQVDVAHDAATKQAESEVGYDRGNVCEVGEPGPDWRDSHAPFANVGANSGIIHTRQGILVLAVSAGASALCITQRKGETLRRREEGF